MIASVFMLAAIIWLYAQDRQLRLSSTIQSALAAGQRWRSRPPAIWLFLGFFSPSR